MQKLIAPSILSADYARLGAEVRAAEAGGADWIHLDVMDGRFVPNLTFGPGLVRALRPLTRRPFDVHLMLERPGEFLKAFAEAGADHLSFHLECGQEPAALCRRIRRLGKRAGLCLKPGTALDSLGPLLGLVDLVVIMSVEPGFSGQRFMAGQMAKVRRLADLRKKGKAGFLIEVDGGVSATNARQAWAAGADVLVAGTSVFGKKDYRRAIQALRKT
jgi:ribulose-phosphate 3-epimerase